jgi:hypothetical protein
MGMHLLGVLLGMLWMGGPTLGTKTVSEDLLTLERDIHRLTLAVKDSSGAVQSEYIAQLIAVVRSHQTLLLRHPLPTEGEAAVPGAPGQTPKADAKSKGSIQFEPEDLSSGDFE